MRLLWRSRKRCDAAFSLTCQLFVRHQRCEARSNLTGMMIIARELMGDLARMVDQFITQQCIM